MENLMLWLDVAYVIGALVAFVIGGLALLDKEYSKAAAWLSLAVYLRLAAHD